MEFRKSFLLFQNTKFVSSILKCTDFNRNGSFNSLKRLFLQPVFFPIYKYLRLFCLWLKLLTDESIL